MMSKHFDEAFLSSSGSLPDVDEIFDFDAASGTGLGEKPRQASVEDGEFSDVPSDNDDGLFCERRSNFDGNSDDDDAAEEEGIATAGDQVYSWKIDHSSGDHKLRRKLKWLLSRVDIGANRI
jgi:hypothetical protein